MVPWGKQTGDSSNRRGPTVRVRLIYSHHSIAYCMERLVDMPALDPACLHIACYLGTPYMYLRQTCEPSGVLTACGGLLGGVTCDALLAGVQRAATWRSGKVPGLGSGSGSRCDDGRKGINPDSACWIDLVVRPIGDVCVCVIRTCMLGFEIPEMIRRKGDCEPTKCCPLSCSHSLLRGEGTELL